MVGAHGQDPGPVPDAKLLERGHELQVGIPATVRTPYVNTIPAGPRSRWFPGDEDLERRIRAFIRWNAAVMVVKANKHADGIGGHLATFASSAALYEVGFNHFFRGKDDGHAGDHVYFQGHAAPGIYARAFLEGRLTEDQLDHFRREIGGGGPVVATRTRGSCRTSGSTRRCRWASARINSIYQARFNRYLHHRQHRRHQRQSRVWAFLGDGEMRRARDARRHLAGRPRGARQPRSGSSTATCSASTARCAATARSSRSSRRCSAAPAGTSSR